MWAAKVNVNHPKGNPLGPRDYQDRIGVIRNVRVVAEAGLFSGAALLMGRIGEAELAGHTVALQIASLAFQIPFLDNENRNV